VTYLWFHHGYTMPSRSRPGLYRLGVTFVQPAGSYHSAESSTSTNA